MRTLIIAIVLIFLSVVPLHARYVTITWNAVAGATNYILYWGTNSEDLDKAKSTGLVTEYQVAIDQAAVYMSIATVDEVGTGTPSAQILIPADAAAATSTLTGVSATGVIFQ